MAFAMKMDHDAKGKEKSVSSNCNDKPPSPETSMQSSSVVNEGLPLDQLNAFPAGVARPPTDTDKDARAKRDLNDLNWHQASRLLDDLNELGMVGELSDDHKFINMSFGDVNRLVMTMRMVELILNDRVHADRKEKIEHIKPQLDAEHCPDMTALLRELNRSKHDLTQKHSFQSVGVLSRDCVA